MSWSDRVASRLADIRQADQWRTVQPLDGHLPSVTRDGDPVVSFASNDYLGLASHPTVVAAAHQALDRWGAGSGASRLVVGGRPVHDELERELADWRGQEAALLLPTGYMANLGVLATLAASPEVLIVSDALNHASIVDGCRLARGQVAIARHADVAHVEALLQGHAGPAVVVTDTVFSMDGDEAPLTALADVCRRRGALLVLDEAHAVLGPALPVPPAGDELALVRIGTLSKALGSVGGFVAASQDVVDLLVNAARPFIFTTAPAPADTAAALAAVRLVRSEEGRALTQRLRGHVDAIAPGHPSPIVPVVLGAEHAALEAAASLLRQGLLVPAIRPPTVPAGTSRLRITLSAAHTEGDVERLVKTLADLPAPGAA
ncbi:MAG: 8-amino-7-oxononanoate synthase [Acidimicrobiales bacterium]|nr:8-amino-7-oxononanoate synthase [Acidimicrobiales bacterium]